MGDRNNPSPNGSLWELYGSFSLFDKFVEGSWELFVRFMGASWRAGASLLELLGHLLASLIVGVIVFPMHRCFFVLPFFEGF